MFPVPSVQYGNATMLRISFLIDNEDGPEQGEKRHRWEEEVRHRLQQHQAMHKNVTLLFVSAETRGTGWYYIIMQFEAAITGVVPTGC